MRDLIELVEYFKACKVAVKSVTEPFDLNTPIGECVFNMMGNFAQLEHKTMMERINLGLRRRWEQGKWKGGVPPYGYDYNKETEKLEVNEEEAKTVRKMFRHYLRVKSIRMVANYLNGKGIPTRNGGEVDRQHGGGHSIKANVRRRAEDWGRGQRTARAEDSKQENV